MKEDYCSYEVAKLLKEKGFDGECIGCYWDSKKTFDINYEPLSYSDGDLRDEVILAPTHQMAMKWLREKYNIYIVINPDFSPEMLHIYGYIPNVVKCNDRVWRKAPLPGSRKSTNTYEEAVEAALRYSLTNLI